MEEVLIRFPHLGENIFQKLNSKTLIKCKQVNRIFNNFLKVEKLSYFRVIQWYTNCSETLMREIVKKSGGAIIIVTVLREIFGNFMRGTKQSSKYLHKWENSPLHSAAVRGHLAAYQLIMENIENKNPQNVYKLTPLHVAARNGHFFVCELIINNIPEKNPRDQNSGWTPLHFAAQNGHLGVCQLILNNISSKNVQKILATPLKLATQYQDDEIRKTILKMLVLIKYRRVANSRQTTNKKITK